MTATKLATILIAAGSGCLALHCSPRAYAAGNTDTLVIYLSENAYDGDAQFIPFVDGQPIAGAQPVTMHNATGQAQPFIFSGNWGNGQHHVGIKLTNAKTDGRSTGDGHARTLFVSEIAYDGHYLLPNQEITSNERKSFLISGPNSCVSETGRTNAICNKVTAALSGLSLSLPVVYPTNTLQMTSTWTAGAWPMPSQTIQTVIQSASAKIVASMVQVVPAMLPLHSSTVQFSYTVPDNQQLAPGTYQVLQGFPSAAGLQVVSTSQFTVPSANVTLNQTFSGGMTAPDPSIWSPFYRYGTKFANELEAYVPDAVQLIPGQGLRLRADSRNFDGQPYTSGAITTFNGFSQTYGHFEMRAQIPGGAGVWPAFWMLPTDITKSAEIDIFEHLGAIPGILNASFFNPDGSHTTTGCGGPLDWTTSYHVFSLDWQPNQLTWSYDGVVCKTVTQNVPAIPEYLLADLAIGGPLAWGGGINPLTPIPAEFNIDYIKAWQYPAMPAEVLPAIRYLHDVSVTPANPQPGDTITVTGTVATNANTALYDVWFQTFLCDFYTNGCSISEGDSWYSKVSMNANSTATYTINMKLPSNLPSGIYKVQVNTHSDDDHGPFIQYGVAANVMVGNPVPPLP